MYHMNDMYDWKLTWNAQDTYLGKYVPKDKADHTKSGYIMNCYGHLRPIRRHTNGF